MYKPELPLSLRMDASTQGLWVVLYKDIGKDKWVLTYSSWTLLPVETRYTITELEALAIVWGIDHNYHYLFGWFQVVTDHHALCSLMKLKNPGNRLACWVTHLNADSLSHNPLPLHDEGEMRQ